ncbi:MAG: T9SS type A sorting domain-containing protein [Brumimicrobium sp.]|nr:T9SS type A sorting domain-containing protein [Brumimicrobium sp.]
MKRKLLNLIMIVTSIAIYNNAYSQNNLICNGDFEEPETGSGSVLVGSFDYPCWGISPSSKFEVWSSGAYGVPGYSGERFLELQAFDFDTIYQAITDIQPNDFIIISFAHRGRLGYEKVGVQVGSANGPFTNLGVFTDSTDQWGVHTINHQIPSSIGNDDYLIRFYAIQQTPTSSSSMGNFLDDIKVFKGEASLSNIDKNSNYLIFPNPANNQVTISNLPTSAIISIVDLTGKTVYTTATTQSELQISTNDLINGAYFVKVESNGNVATEKLIINK